jgi:hypothetical protein
MRLRERWRRLDLGHWPTSASSERNILRRDRMSEMRLTGFAVEIVPTLACLVIGRPAVTTVGG